MKRTLELEIEEMVYQSLLTEAESRGLTVSEIIRWIISEHTRFSTAVTFPFPTSDNRSIIMDSLLKLSIKSLSSQGLLKCQNCTMPLTSSDLEVGKCHSCGEKI